jgi:hypothetical protein
MSFALPDPIVCNMFGGGPAGTGDEAGCVMDGFKTACRWFGYAVQ